MRKMRAIISLVLLSVVFSLSAQNNIQWRGENRTGIYNEKGLLKSWAAEGPELLWHIDGLNDGHSSVAIDAGKIYITGLTEKTGYIYVLDMNGKLLNKKEYGTEWSESYNGPRGTVTINDGKLYLTTGTGVMVCLDQNTLDIIWKKDIQSDFDAKNITWGITESPLIVNEKIIFTPGGKKHNVVALNKNDGSLIWSCAGEGDPSAYCSPLYLGDQQVPQVVTMTANHVIGIDISTGKKLWSFENKNKHSVHANTPVYGDNMLLCTSGYGKGSTMLRLTNGGKSVEKVWFNAELDDRMGGMIKIGDYAYGSGDANRFWFCVDWKTGEIKYKDGSIGIGVTIAADDMLYHYSQNGDMSLLKVTPEKFNLVSKFPITMGTDQHWAHPVIYQGVLYVRHGNTLMAYKIK
jgi:outer membrane protein assembly factor BamB